MACERVKEVERLSTETGTSKTVGGHCVEVTERDLLPLG